MLNIAFLLIGGNLGNRKLLIEQAIGELLKNDELRIVAKSSYYESEPWGFESSDWFVNIVLEIKTSISPIDLLNKCQDIESKLGRERVLDNNIKSYSSRIIDIDIIYYADLILEMENLQIPHPRLHLRKFTLVALSEIAPNFIHPKLQSSNLTLLKICKDLSIVRNIG